MLEYLDLRDVGPAAHLRLDLAPRLNVLTGDNGLGKTFILDVAWYLLTHTWAGERVMGRATDGSHPVIEYKVTGLQSPAEDRFQFEYQRWFREQYTQYQYNNEIAIYARVDGSFCVRDLARNPDPLQGTSWPRADAWFRSQTFQLDSNTLWNGLPEEDGRVLCNGLIRDWTTWQYSHPTKFALFAQILEGLSPSLEEVLRPGKPSRVYVDDAREFPTLELPYGTVPVTHASAGMRRILALAYLLVWAWTEHVAASELRRQEPSDQLVLLFDEVESHLHPQWQRVILPALLKVVEALRPDMRVQVLATTHAPLVLASLETTFDEQTDAVFTLELKERELSVMSVPWAKQGDVKNP
jgi:predicted ATPase